MTTYTEIELFSPTEDRWTLENLIELLESGTLDDINMQWISEDPDCREAESAEFFAAELVEAREALEELDGGAEDAAESDWLYRTHYAGMAY